VFGWVRRRLRRVRERAEDQFIRKPANLTFEQAAAVGVSASTALQLLRDTGQGRAGDRRSW
jgi:NADPH:quinone reductase-like Zn-dependent oxidoreductase